MSDIYRMDPVSAYDIRGLERWLEDMARQGLHVKKCWDRFCVFQKGPPRPTRYRFEPCRTEGPEIPRAMVDLFRDYGWEPVCDLYLDLVLFSTQDPEAPEPHTDPELQGELFRELWRSKRQRARGLLLGDLFIAAGDLWRSAGLWRIPLFLPFYLALLAILVIRNVLRWGDLRELGRIVRRLEAGIPLDHHPPYPSRRWINWLSFGSQAAVLVLFLVLLVMILAGWG